MMRGHLCGEKDGHVQRPWGRKAHSVCEAQKSELECGAWGERQVKKERGPMKQDKGSGIQSEHKKLP